MNFLEVLLKVIRAEDLLSSARSETVAFYMFGKSVLACRDREVAAAITADVA